MDCMFVFPQNSCVDILTSGETVVGNGACVR